MPLTLCCARSQGEEKNKGSLAVRSSELKELEAETSNSPERCADRRPTTREQGAGEEEQPGVAFPVCPLHVRGHKAPTAVPLSSDCLFARKSEHSDSRKPGVGGWC